MIRGIKSCVAVLFIVIFITNYFAYPYADAGDLSLPALGVRVVVSPEFNPPILKGIKVHRDNPFRFEFILDKGDAPLSSPNQESAELIKYFLAALTTPDQDLWVNLSPYEKDRIVPQEFGQTEMGRDLLAEDYILKQITASLIYPEDEIGKKFWKRIYQEAQRKYGTTNIPISTFNKVWIVPDKAVVYENTKAGTAYVLESSLKVMLEQDYLSMKKHTVPPLLYKEGVRGSLKDVGTLCSQILKEIVIPQLEHEVNHGKNFAQLRQVYNSLILAAWYKKKIKDSILSQVYEDKNKVAGININDPQEKEKIYQRYIQAFKKGVFNYIREVPNMSSLNDNPNMSSPNDNSNMSSPNDNSNMSSPNALIGDPEHATIPRKYFSGGFDLEMKVRLSITTTMNPAQLVTPKNLDVISSQFNMAMMSRAELFARVDGILFENENGIPKFCKIKNFNNTRFTPLFLVSNKSFWRRTDPSKESEYTQGVRKIATRPILESEVALETSTDPVSGEPIVKFYAFGLASHHVQIRYHQGQYLGSIVGGEIEEGVTEEYIRLVAGDNIGKHITDFLKLSRAKARQLELPLANRAMNGTLIHATHFPSYESALALHPELEKDIFSNFRLWDDPNVIREISLTYPEFNSKFAKFGNMDDKQLAEALIRFFKLLSSLLDRLEYFPGFIRTDQYRGVEALDALANDIAANMPIYMKSLEHLYVPEPPGKLTKEQVQEYLGILKAVIDRWKEEKAPDEDVHQALKIFTDSKQRASKKPKPTNRNGTAKKRTKPLNGSNLLAKREAFILSRSAKIIDPVTEEWYTKFKNASNIPWESGEKILSFIQPDAKSIQLISIEGMYHASRVIILPENKSKAFQLDLKTTVTLKFSNNAEIILHVRDTRNKYPDIRKLEISAWKWGDNTKNAEIEKEVRRGLGLDPAMPATGGIDLTASKLNLQTASSNGEIKFHLNPAMLAQFQNAPGFTPEIMSVKPLKDLEAFLQAQ